jgi:hypothetical protein
MFKFKEFKSEFEASNVDNLGYESGAQDTFQ